MEVTYSHCAGLDVHKKLVVACCLWPTESGKLSKETRSFGTTTQELLSLSSWLSSLEVTHIAMESTGEYWKPIYNILESSFEVMVVNAQHIKNVPGRKTDVKDAEWIAQLTRHGLLRGSFIPPLPQRDLRDLTRQRTTLVRERASVVNRLQKVLEWANIKLACVVTDITGVSARSMLKALAQGQNDAKVLATYAKGRLVPKQIELEKALQGQVREHHRFLLASHLTHLEFLEEQIACKNSYLNAVYRRLVARRGHKKAIVAVAHRIVIALYHMLTKHEPYRDLGVNYLDTRQQDRLLQRLCHRATALGYQVQLTPIAQPISQT